MDIKTQILKEAEKRYPESEGCGYGSHHIFKEGAEWLHTEVVLPLQKELKDEEKMKLQWVDMYNKEYQLTKSLQSQLSLSEGRVKELEDELKGYQLYKANVDQALNSGDGVYRP